MLVLKAKQYATANDRLSNFKEAAGLRGTNPIDALVGMVVKHWTSISDMAKNPLAYTEDQWDEKWRDDRNYTYLAKGLLLDMKIDNTKDAQERYRNIISVRKANRRRKK
jgi:hypothetical protein